MYQMQGALTELLEPLLKPEQANDDDDDVDEAKVGDGREEVDGELLVSFEGFDVDAGQPRLAKRPNFDTRLFLLCRAAAGQRRGTTHVFKPDSVVALTPKK